MDKPYNYSKLLGLMKEKGYTQHTLASKIPMNPATLNGRLHNKSEFNQREIIKISYELGISIEDVPVYFFAH